MPPRRHGRAAQLECPAIAARANAAREGREAEFDEAIGQFCDEYNRGTPERARVEMEYLVAVGTKR